MSDYIKIGDGITITLLEIQSGVAKLEIPEGTPIVLSEDVKKPGDPNDLGLDVRD